MRVGKHPGSIWILISLASPILPVLSPFLSCLNSISAYVVFFFFSLLLLGNYWPRSSVHANSLRLVSSILSVDLVVVLSSLQGWVKRTVFATEGFCFCEGFLLRYPPLRGPFADGHYLRELWPAIVFPGSGWQRIELKWDLYSNRQTWEWIYGLLGTDFSKQISV